jgi:hypothetical protein
MMALLLSGLWEAEPVGYRLALVVWVAAWAQWLCLALDYQVYTLPKALVSQVVVVERVAHRVSVAARVVLAQAVYRLAQVACRLALVELPAVLVEVSGTWKRHNLGRTPGRV